MKKLPVVIGLSILLVLLSTSVIGAEKPPGVAPAAVVNDAGICMAGYMIDGVFVSVYQGTLSWVFSNGATGHALFRCQMELAPGATPIYDSWIEKDFPYPGCKMSVSLAGDTAQMNAQCKGMYAPS